MPSCNCRYDESAVICVSTSLTLPVLTPHPQNLSPSSCFDIRPTLSDSRSAQASTHSKMTAQNQVSSPVKVCSLQVQSPLCEDLPAFERPYRGPTQGSAASASL
jgi:hypothetical protein